VVVGAWLALLLVTGLIWDFLTPDDFQTEFDRQAHLSHGGPAA